MAGDWIPIDVNIHSKPKVLRIAKLIDRSPHEVVGMLVAFWSWAQAHTSDGVLPAMDAAMIAAGAQVPAAFVDALVQVGWLLIDDTRCLIPNWDEWLSGGAKARAQARRRVTSYRANVSRHPPQTGSKDDVTHERYKSARSCNAARVTGLRAHEALVHEIHAQAQRPDSGADACTDGHGNDGQNEVEHTPQHPPADGGAQPAKPGEDCNASVTHERYSSAHLCNASVTHERYQRREEKRIIKDPPHRSPPRQRGGDSIEALAHVVYPDGCDTPQVRQALVEWLDYRRTIGKPYRTPAQQLSLLLARYGTSIVSAIQHSIAQGYQGCFPPSRAGPDKTEERAAYVYDPNFPYESL